MNPQSVVVIFAQARFPGADMNDHHRWVADGPDGDGAAVQLFKQLCDPGDLLVVVEADGLPVVSVHQGAGARASEWHASLAGVAAWFTVTAETIEGTHGVFTLTRPTKGEPA